ncbi:hypothetical protein [Nonomuraea sp. LPB2021202275-12-8]|uniref:hypothetical protein n=1 Tax=Nonomuraea sp. LPB2021202275-12-8 TaxID=3120159 RepID=UPI00300D9CBF
MLERLALLAAVVLFCGWAVSLLIGGERTKATPESADEETDAEPEGKATPESKDKPEDEQVRTGWRWLRTAQQVRPPIVTVERFEVPQPVPQPAAPKRPALHSVPDPDPAEPEGLDPMSIANRAYRLARQRQAVKPAAATADAKVIALPAKQRPSTTVAAPPVVEAYAPVAALGAPGAGQMNALVTTIDEAAAIMARIPPAGDIRNPIAQIASFARAVAALWRRMRELRQRLSDDQHDLYVLAAADQAEAAIRVAAAATAEAAMVAAMRYRGAAADQAEGTRLPHVNRH